MDAMRIDDFELPGTGGNFRFSEQPARTLVLYFYPKDSTPGCTTEAQQFRDLHPQFEALECIVVGVSRDSVRSHQNFKAKLDLPFELLSDSEEKLCQRFAVIREKKLYGKPVRGIERSTFVIDRSGLLQGEWRSVKTAGHAQEILDFVRGLPR